MIVLQHLILVVHADFTIMLLVVRPSIWLSRTNGYMLISNADMASIAYIRFNTFLTYKLTTLLRSTTNNLAFIFKHYALR